jgi:hypothetical protein
MKLDELHVRHPAAGAPGHRDAVTGRGVRIGRIEVDLARRRRRRSGCAGAERQYLTAGTVEHVGPMAALLIRARACRR